MINDKFLINDKSIRWRRELRDYATTWHKTQHAKYSNVDVTSCATQKSYPRMYVRIGIIK